MKIALVHNRVADQAGPDARDVLVQAEAIEQALAGLGHQAVRLACDLDLEAMRRELTARRPDLVFNLVEDLGGHGRLIHLFPFLLDALGLPYSGSPAEVILLTSHKTMAKERLHRAGLPTPAWVGPCPARSVAPELNADMVSGRRWIVKSLWEHASVGLGADSVLSAETPQTLRAELARRAADLGGVCFAEEFIDGREFNLSLLAGPDGPQMLPPAEILFEGFTPEMLKIVDYQAKWEADSFGYHHTPRSFDFGAADAGLLDELTAIARQCWAVFGLGGYARVDFRVDPAGRPFILEVNANPCLSPDAGYAAALARAGIGFDQAVARIIADARSHPPA